MAKAAALATVGSLGLFAAVESPFSWADPPADGRTATVYRTVTETVNRRVEGRGVWWWRDRAIRNRKALNGTRITLQRIRAVSRARWTPTVRYAISLARTVYGYDLTRRTYCESTNNPFAVSPGGHQGLLQFLGSTWRSTPFAGFSPFDPVAAELAGGWMIRAGRSGEWSCGL
jgi:hypothetical protein